VSSESPAQAPSINAGLHKADLHPDPFQQFEAWFSEACATEMTLPNAMSLATASKAGAPTLRTVLLKTFDRDGLVFFTNYGSEKARQIQENPHVALLFPWLTLERQVKILGIASKVAASESLRYFVTRPRGSQIGAWVSQQSQIISSRKILNDAVQTLSKRFAGKEVPLPGFWGGYRVLPSVFEFWQGRPDRLHDRFAYTRKGGVWQIDRLAP